jgi:hypothetical protein
VAWQGRALVVQLFDSMLYSEAGRRGERSGCRSRCRARQYMCSPRRRASARVYIVCFTAVTAAECFVLLLFRLTRTFMVFLFGFYAFPTKLLLLLREFFFCFF